MLGLFASYFMPVTGSDDTFQSNAVISGHNAESLKKYEVLEELGSGTFAEVHHVRCKGKRSEYAMKAMKKTDNNKCLFDKEIAVAKRLPPHPNIVQIKKYMEDEDKCYLVTEFFKGEHILDYVSDLHRKGCSEVELKKLFVQIASALNHAHVHGIAHLDIKSENILVDTETQTVKLIDFGISVIQVEEGASCAQFSGSLHFAAPEILKQDPFCPFKADVYSLGILLYAMVFDTMPFLQPEIRVSYSRMGFHPSYEEWPESPILGGISDEGLDLIKSMLVVEPDSRASMKEVLHHEWLCDVAQQSPESE